MINKNALLTVLLPAALCCLMASCGGGSTTPTHFTDPNGDPGTVFNGGGGGGTPMDIGPLADLMSPTPVVGDTPSAPLGTNPLYDVEEVAPTNIDGSGVSSIRLAQPLKGARALVGPYSVTDMTVGQFEDSPDFTVPDNELNFPEGEVISLYVQYQVLQGETVQRSFDIPELDYHYGDNYTEATGNEHILRLDVLTPYVMGNDDTPSTFTFNIGGSGGITQVQTFTVGNVVADWQPTMGWQIAWETQLVRADYDYNDLIIRMDSTEVVCMDEREQFDDIKNKVVQIDVIVKAIARGEGYSGDWQFNLDSDVFSEDTYVVSTTRQFLAGNVTPDGPTRTWKSTMGVSLPVFTPIRNVLPSRPGTNSLVNVQTTENYSGGGLARVCIRPFQGLDIGSYRPLPWTNQMLIPNTEDGYNREGDVYVISLSTNRGGNKVANDPHPLGFILPYNAPPFNWPMEGVDIDNVYTGGGTLPSFQDWVTWWNMPTTDPAYNTALEPQWWGYDPSLLSNDQAPPCYQTSNNHVSVPDGPELPIPY